MLHRVREYEPCATAARPAALLLLVYSTSPAADALDLLHVIGLQQVIG